MRNPDGAKDYAKVSKIKFLASAFLTAGMLIAISAKAEIVNLECRYPEYAHDPKMLPFYYWVDLERKTVTVGSPRNMSDASRGLLLETIAATITPDLFTWTYVGGHTFTVNRRSGVLTASSGPIQQFLNCEKGTTPLPATKF